MRAKPPITSKSKVLEAAYVDALVGTRIRTLRQDHGVPQEKLAEALGVTAQQLQKYEMGINRVAASRLYEIAVAFDIPVSFFFQELPARAAESQDAIDDSDFDIGPISGETAKLIQAFGAITDVEVRKRMLGLLRSLGPEHPQGKPE